VEKPSIERRGKYIQRREAAAKLLKPKQQRQTKGPHPVSTNKPIIGQNSAPNMYLLKQRKPSWKNPAFMKPFVLVLHLATKSTS